MFLILQGNIAISAYSHNLNYPMTQPSTHPTKGKRVALLQHHPWLQGSCTTGYQGAQEAADRFYAECRCGGEGAPLPSPDLPHTGVSTGGVPSEPTNHQPMWFMRQAPVAKDRPVVALHCG